MLESGCGLCSKFSARICLCFCHYFVTGSGPVLWLILMMLKKKKKPSVGKQLCWFFCAFPCIVLFFLPFLCFLFYCSLFPALFFFKQRRDTWQNFIGSKAPAFPSLMSLKCPRLCFSFHFPLRLLSTTSASPSLKFNSQSFSFLLLFLLSSLHSPGKAKVRLSTVTIGQKWMIYTLLLNIFVW